MKLKNKIAVLMIALIMVSGTAALIPAYAQVKNDPAETYKFLNLFGDIFERVRAEYVEERSDEEIIEAAITGMLTSLDPHSSYLNAKSYKEMRVNTRGEFGGLGIQVTMEKGYVKVISPIDDTPAYRAGVEAGDFITHLDDKLVQGMTLAEAVEKMRGKVGSDIKLTIRREGKADAFDVTITRAIINITSVRSRIEGKVGYVRITSFNEKTDAGLKKAFEKFDKELKDDLQGAVLDLRNNPGGLLDQAIAVSDAFMEKGEIVSTRSRNPEDIQRFNARVGDLAKGLPVVVLINGGSASASEIVAGALQDHRRAVIMGTRSFGKGSVQTIMPVPGHGAMRLTTARYYTPSGRSIQGLGIDPDIEVKQATIETIDTVSGRREADLSGALKNDNSKRDSNGVTDTNDKTEDVNKDKADEQKAEKEEIADYQLARALDLIRGMALFKSNAAARIN